MGEEKKAAILDSLQAVNEDLKAIGKDQQGYNYKFRGIDAVLNAISPLFKKHNIIVRRMPVDVRQSIFIDKKENKYNHATILINYCFVSTKDGSELVTFGFGEGHDKGDKALSCATSNAFKYVIFEMFCIPTEEQLDSDMKTALENGVESSAKPKKVAKPEEKKKAGFRRKKVVKEEPIEEGVEEL